MIGELNDKNPISVINEFCLKTNSKIDYEFQTENNEFVAFVIFNDEVIGKGKDKKKQAAKTKAAENAVIHLSEKKSKDSTQSQLEESFKKLGKRGNFKLSFQDPNFIYEYFINGSLLAESHSISEPVAKQKCIKKVLKKITFIEPKPEPKKSKKKSVLKHQDLRPQPGSLSIDMRVLAFLEERLQSFELIPEEKLEVTRIEQEIAQLSKNLGLSLVPVGSYFLKAVRRTKLALDFCLVIENITESTVYSIFEALEKSRIVFLESKQHKVELSGFGLAYSPTLINNSDGFSYIKLENDSFLYFIYFYESLNHPSLQHYVLKKNQNFDGCRAKTLSLLRHWRQMRKLVVPIELLDLIVQEYVLDDSSVYVALRIVLELVSGGIFLKGSSYAVTSSSFEYFLGKFSLENMAKVMSEAQKSLISLSMGENRLILD